MNRLWARDWSVNNDNTHSGFHLTGSPGFQFSRQVGYGACHPGSWKTPWGETRNISRPRVRRQFYFLGHRTPH
ncbi:hypothetical protein J6590_102103 [Homalodisca vitripennis]|nr:hypothetical protein J6590_102103 [Homalodisca vitripennis]